MLTHQPLNLEISSNLKLVEFFEVGFSKFKNNQHLLFKITPLISSDNQATNWVKYP